MSPRFTYNGLTVVLSQPSRMDAKLGGLLTANGGQFFADCLSPELTRFGCDIRLAGNKKEFQPDTKCVLLLGEKAMELHLGEQARGNSLGELRGSPFVVNGIPHIASYFPQDAVDLKDYEKEHNVLRANEEIGRKEDEEGDDKRRHGKTSRSNYSFWLDADIRRCKYILKNGIPKRDREPAFNIYPQSKGIIEELLTTKGKFLYLDIETDRFLNILCISYSFGLPTITVVPFLNHRYEWAYDNLHLIYRAFATAICDNVAVAHNGANFDFFVFAYKYRIPINRVYDTMVAQHRIFPDAEKSLGHCQSYWTWEPFHKDLGNVGYYTESDCRQTWQYCGLDVYSMILIHEAQQAYAAKVPGLVESIQQANDSIAPYLITSLTGIRYKPELVAETIKENDGLMMQYIRFINYLVGDTTISKYRRRYKGSLPSSNAQCVDYFHTQLGYSVASWGKEKKDGTKGPSLAKTAIFKLQQNLASQSPPVINPVLDLTIAYRETAKETGTLNFTPLYEPTTTESSLGPPSSEICST